MRLAEQRNGALREAVSHEEPSECIQHDDLLRCACIGGLGGLQRFIETAHFSQEQGEVVSGSNGRIVQLDDSPIGVDGLRPGPGPIECIGEVLLHTRITGANLQISPVVALRLDPVSCHRSVISEHLEGCRIVWIEGQRSLGSCFRAISFVLDDEQIDPGAKQRAIGRTALDGGLHQCKSIRS